VHRCRYRCGHCQVQPPTCMLPQIGYQAAPLVVPPSGNSCDTEPALSAMEGGVRRTALQASAERPPDSPYLRAGPLSCGIVRTSGPGA
jgi:hypothetical protein